MTYLLFVLAFFAGLLLFDYFKTRDLARARDLYNETKALREEMEHMQHRVEHLEAIIADQEYDPYSNTSETKRQKTDS